MSQLIETINLNPPTLAPISGSLSFPDKIMFIDRFKL